jgi:hypothetical protein
LKHKIFSLASENMPFERSSLLVIIILIALFFFFCSCAYNSYLTTETFEEEQSDTGATNGSGRSQNGSESPASNGASAGNTVGAVQGPCKGQLTSSELLPHSSTSDEWAIHNPKGTGSLAGVNFVEAGYHMGVNTVGQTLRNANWGIRSEPPNPVLKVGPWMNSTIEPDTNRRPLEIKEQSVNMDEVHPAGEF